MKKPTLLVIFLTVFIDLIGFGIVLPLLPIYGKHFGASGFLVGLLMASFSFMQFIFAPLWGRLSDRIGRRPVLLLSTAGAALSYACFAVGSTQTSNMALWVLLASRIFAGLFGANITVAQAYIADITPPEKRSQKMGLVGMAFGFGFIFGPAIGAFSYKAFGMAGPGWVAAGLCAFNLVLAWRILPETLRPDSAHAAERPQMAQWSHILTRPKVGLLVMVFFLATFCFSSFETTLGLLISENFHLDIQRDDHAKTVVGYLFAYCGIIGAFIQGGAIGRLVRQIGESRLISVSLFISAAAMALLPFIHGNEPFRWASLVMKTGWPWLSLLLVLGLLSIGTSLTRPPLFGMLSNLSSSRDQGVTIGVAQSAGSLARIVAPIFAAITFDHQHNVPYLICAVILLLAGIWTWGALCRDLPVSVAGRPQNVS